MAKRSIPLCVNYHCDKKADYIVTDILGQKMPVCKQHIDNYRVASKKKIKARVK